MNSDRDDDPVTVHESTDDTAKLAAEARSAARRAAVISGVGAAAVGAVGWVGSEMAADAVEQAKNEAIAELDLRQQTDVQEASAKILGLGEEQSSRLQLQADSIEDRLVVQSEDLAAGLIQRLHEAAERLTHQVEDSLFSIMRDGERELHRLSQELEAEITEQREQALAEIRGAGARAVELAQTQLEGIRSEAERVASVVSANMDERIHQFETKVSGAVESVHTAAETRVSELHNLQGSFRVDQGANPEDDYEIG
jgi:ribosomal protein S13